MEDLEKTDHEDLEAPDSSDTVAAFRKASKEFEKNGEARPAREALAPLPVRLVD